MIIRKVIKIKLLEWALDIFFNRVINNFYSWDKECIKEGDEFRTVICRHENNFHVIYNFCKISKLQHNGTIVRLEFEKQIITFNEKVTIYDGKDYVWEPIEILEFFKYS